MPENVTEWLNLVFRWIHVVAGITWIGHLYFFNWVNAHVAKTYDADSKKKVVPELMPRALYWFRWGAAWTWITGVLLAGIVIWMSEDVLRGTNPNTNYLGQWPTIDIAFGLFIVGFLVYDLLWKSPLAKNEMVGVAVSFALLVAACFGLSRIMGGRSMFIHIGALLGTIMAGNVWMRIWPAQRKIIGGIAGTSPAADAAIPAMAGLRSKHNTYMSVPLVFTMISNHFGTVYGHDLNWLILAGFIAAGFAATKGLYVMSARANAKAY